MPIEAVICHVIRGDRILLHRKKRGHGAGRWNGFGGKIMEGESPEECVRREALEEMGVGVENIREMGTLVFHNVNGEEWVVHVFLADVVGEPEESEESTPRWFPLDAIPYGEMWDDDRFWLPTVIRGMRVEGEFWFEGEELRRFTLHATEVRD